MSNTLSYVYGNGNKEFVFSCKNRTFAVLCSKDLPTPATTMIDHSLVMELGLKVTDLQCKKICFAGRKLRLLGKISTTVQCIKDGKMFANIHLRGSVVENLKDVIDSHCIAGQKFATMLSGPPVPTYDVDDDEISAKPCVTSPTPSMLSSSKSGTPPNTSLTSIVFSDTAASKMTPSGVSVTNKRCGHVYDNGMVNRYLEKLENSGKKQRCPVSNCTNDNIKLPDVAKTPPSYARRLVMEEGLSPLTANLATIDTMFGGADIFSDAEEEDAVLDKHGRDHDDNILYKSGHGRYKCNLVQCDVSDDPWGQVPHNCGFHLDYSLPDNFSACGHFCRGAFCRCLKFYQSLEDGEERR